MENTFTFKQTENQTMVVLVILGATILLMGSFFLGFYLFGAESSASFIFSFSVAALIFAGIFVFVRKFMLRAYTMAVGQEGFSITDHASQAETRYLWADVLRYKSGLYNAAGVRKEYLWIWMKADKRKFFVEDDGSDQERTRKYEEFRSLCMQYLKQNVV